MIEPVARDTGTVVRWLAARGFGWIAPDAGGRGVFVHATSLERGTGLKVGERVQYLTVKDAKGARAVGVRFHDAQPAAKPPASGAPVSSTKSI